MHHAIAWIFEMLMRMVIPSSGRHRSADQVPSAALRADAPTKPLPLVPVPPLRDEDVALVRPYRVAHERRMEAARQRARRRTLWLAVRGVDGGPCWIRVVQVVGR